MTRFIKNWPQDLALEKWHPSTPRWYRVLRETLYALLLVMWVLILTGILPGYLILYGGK